MSRSVRTGGDIPGGASYSADGAILYEVGGDVGYRVLSNLELRAGYRYLSVPDALFADDFAAAATRRSTQSIVPDPRRLGVQMVTVGVRVLFGKVN